MPTARREQPHHADDIDRELDKLRGFGGTLVIALGASAFVIAAITVLLWLAVF
jgi:hypothetical protein